MHRPSRRTTRTTSTWALALLLGVLLSACSGDGGGPGEPGANGGPGVGAEGPPPLETTATLGEVAGKLSGPRRAQLTAHVTEVVDGWIDAAYLGDYPRTDFADAFAGFSERAAAQARADGALMSNQALARGLDEVVAVQRRLSIDAVASRGRAVGVTARVDLTMRLGGAVDRKQKVSCRLFLSYRDGGWQVFGYDVTRGGAR